MTVKNDSEKKKECSTDEYGMAIFIALGLMFGSALGQVLDNLGMGLSLGLGLGGLANAIWEKRMDKPGNSLALVIWASALLAVLALWIWAA